MRRIHPELLWSAAAQAGSLVGGLVAIKVTTSLLGPAEYGQLAVALSIVGITSVCLYGPVVQAASRFYAVAHFGGRMRDYVRTLTRLLVLCAALVAVVAISIGLPAWAMTGVAGLLTAMAIAVYAIVSGSQAILVATYNAARRRRIAAAGQIAEAALRPMLIALLIVWLGGVAEVALAAYGLTALVILTMLVILIRPSALLDGTSPQGAVVRRGEPVRVPREMLRYTWAFLVFGVAGALGSHGERLLLIAWVPWKAVGIYAAMSQLAGLPTAFLLGVINQFYFPLVFQNMARERPHPAAFVSRGYARYLTASLLVIALGAAAVTLFGEQILALVTTEDFGGYEGALWVLAASAGVFHIGQQLTLEGLAANRPARYIIPKLLHSISVVGLALVLVPRYGIIGMAWASLFGAAIYATAVVAANRTRAQTLGKALLLGAATRGSQGRD
jgi:O-antigen/teichoic acid export membrane protein